MRGWTMTLVLHTNVTKDFRPLRNSETNQTSRVWTREDGGQDESRPGRVVIKVMSRVVSQIDLPQAGSGYGSEGIVEVQRLLG